MVHVFVKPSHSELFTRLAGLFHFNVVLFDGADDYGKVLEKVSLQFQPEYAVILKPGVIPTPNFLLYLSHCLNEMERDVSIVTASAWNGNAPVSSSDTHANYTRVNLFIPAPASVIRRSLYGKLKGFMPRKAKENVDRFPCCSKKWQQRLDIGGSLKTLIPDVSMVTVVC